MPNESYNSETVASNMMKNNKNALVVFSLFLLLFPLSKSHALEVSAYAKTSSIHSEGGARQKSATSLENMLRIKTLFQASESIDIEFAYECIPLIQGKRESLENFPRRTEDYRLKDFKRRLDSLCDDCPIFHNLDRACIRYALPAADICIGRQAISFGAARIVNPTDVFLPHAFHSLNKEDRIGVDAVRCSIPSGDLSEIDIGIVLGNNMNRKKSAAFLSKRIHLYESDLSALIMAFKKNFLIGFDIQRAIGQAGFWLETAYVFAQSSSETRIQSKNYLRASSGLDYNVNDKLYFFGEYHFNGPGSRASKKTLSNASQTAYKEGSAYLLYRHYLIPGTLYQISPLLSLNGKLLYCIVPSSAMLHTALQYNLKENRYLDIGVLQNFGHSSSEFKSYPNQIYLSLKGYF